ncbi:MAG: hypothetical protein ACRDYC_03305 [Acidimicrobiales bacterium]
MKVKNTKARQQLTDAAAVAGIGAIAGLAGTAAMTLSSTVEAKIRHRGASQVPAEAAETVLGVEANDPSSKRRFNNVVHWVYGGAWGVARGGLDLLGLHGVRASAAHLGAVVGAEQIVLPATKAAQPFWKWGPKTIALDLLHHLTYAAVTGAVFEALDPHRKHRRTRRHGVRAVLA